jgi:hypothetical protein
MCIACWGRGDDRPQPMPRKATSPSEIEQIARVRMLLRGFSLYPSPELRITTATRKTYAGQLVRDHVGSNARKGTRRKGARLTYYGTIVLLTGDGEVEIDYLDIVLVEPGHPEGIPSPPAGTPPCGQADGSGMLPA